MRTVAKLLALFYGSQMLLGGIGMGLFCYLSPTAFSGAADENGFDTRLFLMTAGLIPQVGLGSLLIWLGLPSRSRQRTWRLTWKAVKHVIEN